MDGDRLSSTLWVGELRLLALEDTITLLTLFGYVFSLGIGNGSPVVGYLQTVLGVAVFCVLPGLFVLRVTGHRGTSTAEKLIYVVGSGFAIFGVLVALVSTFVPLLGIEAPLSRGYLTSGMVVILTALAGTAKALDRPPVFSRSTVPTTEPLASPYVIYFFLLPVFATASARFFSATGSKLMLVVFLGTVALCPIFVKYGKIPQVAYPVAVFLVAVALQWHGTMVTDYTWGWDIQQAVLTTSLSLEKGRWMPTLGPSRSTILLTTGVPAGLTVVTNLSIDWVFKLLYPVVFSLVPVGIYEVCEDELNPELAVYASLLFAFTFTFYDTMPEKQQFAEFYALLLIMVLIHQGIVKHSTEHTVLLTLFGLGLVLSHYGTGLLILGMLVASIGLAKTAVLLGYDVRQPVSVPFVGLFGVFLLFWYMTWAPDTIFHNFVMVPYLAVRGLLQALFGGGSGASIVESRTGLSALMKELDLVLKQIYRLIHITLQGFIFVGIGATVVNRLRQDGPRLSDCYLLLTLPLFGILIGGVFFRAAFGFDRAFEISLIMLAGAAVVGHGFLKDVANRIVIWLDRANPRSAKFIIPSIATLLLVFFIFNSGLVFYVSGAPGSGFPLNHPETDYPAFERQEVQTAEWADRYLSNEEEVFADEYGRLLLNREMNRDRIRSVTSGSPAGGCVIHRQVNVQGKATIEPEQDIYQTVNVSTISKFQQSTGVDRVFDSGTTKIACHDS